MRVPSLLRTVGHRCQRPNPAEVPNGFPQKNPDETACVRNIVPAAPVSKGVQPHEGERDVCTLRALALGPVVAVATSIDYVTVAHPDTIQPLAVARRLPRFKARSTRHRSIPTRTAAS